VTELSLRRWIPVISFENIIELFQHRNAQTVNSRVSMFAKLPQIAHIDSVQHPGFPGSIADVLAREVRAFLSAKTSDVFSVAESARSRLFAFCGGRKIANWLRRDMAVLWPLAQQDHARNKFLSSVSHIDIMRAGNKKIGKLRADDRVDRAAIARHRASLTKHMKTELRARGVKGVGHDAFAEQFALGSEARLLAIAGPKGHCTVGEFVNKSLRSNGIDPAQVNGNTTVNEIAALTGFSHKLKVVSRALGLHRPVTPSEIPIDKCPSEIVQSGIERRRRSAPRAQSGDLIDSNLSVLACYCDITIVDKRTNEYIRQLRMQNGVANALIRKVVCLSKYVDLLSEKF